MIKSLQLKAFRLKAFRVKTLLFSFAKRPMLMALSAVSLVSMVVIPATSQASGSLHLDLPGLSIGLHDDTHYRHVNKKSSRHDRRRSSKSKQYYYGNRYDRKYRNNSSRYNNRYYDKPYYNKPNYNKSYNNGYNNRYYKKRYYNNRYNNYNGGRSNQYRYRNSYRNNRAQACPEPGYYPYYNDKLNCYKHKGHFHCS